MTPFCRITYYIGSHFEIQDGGYIGPKLSWNLVLFLVYMFLYLCAKFHTLYISGMTVSPLYFTNGSRMSIDSGKRYLPDLVIFQASKVIFETYRAERKL